MEKDLRRDTGRGLGCPRDRLEAQLHKLLVYEPGGFFLPHRDTEKTTGMVATLMVALPVAGGSGGGEIVVRHKDREMSLDTSVLEPSEIAWAAFYADCRHEVRPVTGGHRVVLVFNLALRNGAGALGAPDFDAETERMARALSAWSAEAEKDEKLILLLDHDYSEEGLSFESLKSVDAAVAEVMLKAATEAGCELHAAIVDIYESAQPDYDAYGDGAPGESAFLTKNLLGYRYDLESFTAPDGRRPEFGTIPFRKEEILPGDALSGREPQEEGMEEEWTGNAGATYERIYRLAALSLWPRRNSIFVIASGSVVKAVRHAETLARQDGGEAREAASRLVDIWRDPSHVRGDSGEAIRLAIDLLLDLGDASALKDLLADAVIPRYGSALDDHVSKALDALGPDEGRCFLPRLARENLSANAEDIFSLATRLCRGRGADEKWCEPLAGMCREISSGLAGALDKRKREKGRMFTPDEVPLSPGAVGNILEPFLLLGLGQEAARVVNVLINDPESANPDRVVPRALEELGELAATQVLAPLWVATAGFLLERSGEPPQPPTDWTIGSDVGCRCKDCLELRKFCKDPVATKYLFRAAEARRVHLTKVIERRQLDIGTRTEKEQRPYTLVCTKNRKSHKRRRKQYEEDIAEMKRLTASAPLHISELLERLRAAIGRYGRLRPLKRKTGQPHPYCTARGRED